MFKKFMGGVAAVISIPVAVIGGVGAGAIKSIEDGSLENFGACIRKNR